MNRSSRDRSRGSAPGARLLSLFAAAVLAAALLVPSASGAQSLPHVPVALGGQQQGATASLPLVDPTVAPDRRVKPVVLTGANSPAWPAPANQTVKLPLTDFVDCPPGSDTDKCQHSRYAPPEVDTSGYQGQAPIQGTPVDRLLGYRWNGKKFVQIPFQVDEMFTRYLDSSASRFAIYSGEDQHTPYAFDREPFRMRKEDPSTPSHALQDSLPAT